MRCRASRSVTDIQTERLYNPPPQHRHTHNYLYTPTHTPTVGLAPGKITGQRSQHMANDTLAAYV